MSDDFKPGTRPLLRLAGLDANRAFISRDDESLVLWTAALALLMRIHLDPDPEVRRETGPADAQVLHGLRTALAENFGIEAADYISWVLVEYGCRQKPTLASLHPWEGLMFEWQERRASAPRIALMLRDAGLDRPLKAAALESLDGWLANPATALGEASAITAALFEPQLVSFNLHDDGGTPGHDALFRALVASAYPPPAIVLPRQRLEPGRDGVRWIIEYSHAGIEHAFAAAANGTTVDVAGVLAGVGEVFARIGRPERAFRLESGRAGNGEIGLFVVVDGAKFADVAWRLRLPLRRSPPNLPAAAGIQVAETATSAPAAATRGTPPVPVPVPASAGRAAPAPGGVATPPSASPAPDAMSVLDSGFDVPAPVPAEADPAMRSLLTSLRRSFAAGRLLQAGRWVRQSNVTAPEWLLASADPIGILYGKQELLLRKGRIGWGALVEADPGLFAVGDDDLPALIVYSTDAWFDGHPAELAAIAARLVGLKTAATAGSAIAPADATGGEPRRIGQQIRNDSGRPLDVALPPAMSVHPVLLTSLMGIRAHLPEGRFEADWFPLLTHPSSVIPMIVPSAFWTSAMRAAWDERKLCVRSSGPAAAR